MRFTAALLAEIGLVSQRAGTRLAISVADLRGDAESLLV